MNVGAVDLGFEDDGVDELGIMYFVQVSSDERVVLVELGEVPDVEKPERFDTTELIFDVTVARDRGVVEQL
jgi:hypothetical protein